MKTEDVGRGEPSALAEIRRARSFAVFTRAFHSLFWQLEGLPKPGSGNIEVALKNAEKALSVIRNAVRLWPGKDAPVQDKLAAMMQFKRVAVSPDSWMNIANGNYRVKIPDAQFRMIAGTGIDGFAESLAEIEFEYKHGGFFTGSKVNLSSKHGNAIFEAAMDAGRNLVREIAGKDPEAFREQVLKANGESEFNRVKRGLREAWAELESLEAVALEDARRQGRRVRGKYVDGSRIDRALLIDILEPRYPKLIRRIVDGSNQLNAIRRGFSDEADSRRHYYMHRPTAKAVAVYSKFMRGLEARSPVSEKEAAEWGERQEFAREAQDKLERTGETTGQTVAKTRRQMAEFYRMVGGGIQPCFMTYSAKRAHANGDTINIGDDMDKATLWHEMGHVLENGNPVARAAVRRFLAVRAKSDKLKKIPGHGREKGYEDAFYHHYAGKVYSDSDSTELISMGLQMFSDPRLFARLVETDIEHFTLMMGVISMHGYAKK